MDECSDEQQFVHVPHLRAVDEKSLFACDAIVDLEAQSVPQVVRPEESLRVQNVSEDPANLYHGQFGAQHVCQNQTHLLGGSDWLIRECDKFIVDASLDLLPFGASDVGRRRRPTGWRTR